jgi:crossover junction endodeoxyribonuclease RuvC
VVILGVDPGLNSTGYGAVEVRGDRLHAVAAGTIQPNNRAPLSARLQELYKALGGVIARVRPMVMILEAIYTHHQFVTTAAAMAHARGVICLLSAQRGLPLIEYLPTRIKKSLTGHGAASKEQVARSVGAWLGCEVSAWPADATDALALAVAHAHMARRQTVLAAGTGRLITVGRRRSRLVPEVVG